MGRKGYLKGVVMIVLAGTLWSMMGLGVRLIENASAMQILLYRSLGLIPVMFLFIVLRGGWQALWRIGPSSVIGGLGLVVAFGGSMISLQETTVANAVFLLSMTPFFAAILGRLVLGEPVRKMTWITMVMAGTGVAIMVAEGISLGRFTGNVAAIICAMGFAVYSVSLRAEKGAAALPTVLLGGIFSTAAATAAILAAGDSLILVPREAMIATGLGVLVLAGGLILFTLGSRTVPAAEATLMSQLEVVLAPTWVWLAIGERAGPLTLLGGGILLAALVLNALTGLIPARKVRPVPVWRDQR